jgi:hypothetical protein
MSYFCSDSEVRPNAGEGQILAAEPRPSGRDQQIVLLKLWFRPAPAKVPVKPLFYVIHFYFVGPMAGFAWNRRRLKVSTESNLKGIICVMYVES